MMTASPPPHALFMERRHGCQKQRACWDLSLESRRPQHRASVSPSAPHPRPGIWLHSLHATVIQGRACLRALWACSYICSGEPSRRSGDCEEKAFMLIGLNKSPRDGCSGQNLQCYPAPERTWKSHTLPTDPLMQQDLASWKLQLG